MPYAAWPVCGCVKGVLAWVRHSPCSPTLNKLVAVAAIKACLNVGSKSHLRVVEAGNATQNKQKSPSKKMLKIGTWVVGVQGKLYDVPRALVEVCGLSEGSYSGLGQFVTEPASKNMCQAWFCRTSTPSLTPRCPDHYGHRSLLPTLNLPWTTSSSVILVTKCD